MCSIFTLGILFSALCKCSEWFFFYTAEVKKDLELYVEELGRKTEDNSAQKEEITGLLGQVVDLQLKVKVVSNVLFTLN